VKFKWKRAQGINWYYTWVRNPIVGIKDDIKDWWYWRNRCVECGGSGEVELGDYGQSWPEICNKCNGTGKKKR